MLRLVESDSNIDISVNCSVVFKGKIRNINLLALGIRRITEFGWISHVVTGCVGILEYRVRLMEMNYFFLFDEK